MIRKIWVNFLLLFIVFRMADIKIKAEVADTVEHNNHVFIFNRTNGMVYEEAKQFCENSGARLVEIYDNETDKVIREHLKSGDKMYCGGRNYGNSTTVLWESGETSNYQNWNLSEPSSTGEECVVLTTEGWFHVYCSQYNRFICEMIYVYNLTLSSEEVTVTEKTDRREAVTCRADGLPTPELTWRGVEFVTTPSVHDTDTAGQATLWYGGATIYDEGSYICEANNTVNSTITVITGSLQIHVIANPIKVNLSPIACSSNLFIQWEPNPRAQNAPHRIAICQKDEEKFVNVTMDTKLIVEDLNSWTEYTLKVTPCTNTECKNNYTETNSSTSYGLPGKAINISFQSNGPYSCVSKWIPPFAVPEEHITGYMVTVQNTLYATPSEQEPGVYSTKDNTTSGQQSVDLTNDYIFDQPGTTFNLIGQPNRVYTVGVQAKTCAGLGVIKWSKENCVTEPKEPYELSPPRLFSTEINSNGRIKVELSVPNQVNGLISCMFVIVRPDVDLSEKSDIGAFALKDLIVANNTLSVQTSSDYIALSITSSSISSTWLEVELGNGVATRCDASTTTQANSLNTFPYQTLFVGENVMMNRNVNYSIFVATTTPTSAEILIQTSNAVGIIASGSPEKGNAAAIAIVLSILVIGILFLAGIVVWKRRKESQIAAPQKESDLSPSDDQKRQDSRVKKDFHKSTRIYCNINDERCYDASIFFADSYDYDLYAKGPRESTRCELSKTTHESNPYEF